MSVGKRPAPSIPFLELVLRATVEWNLISSAYLSPTKIARSRILEKAPNRFFQGNPVSFSLGMERNLRGQVNEMLSLDYSVRIGK